MSPSSNPPIHTYHRLISEIQGSLQVLTSSLYSIDDKLKSSVDDLRYLMNDVEPE